MDIDLGIIPFAKELDFEKALAKMLSEHGWEPHVLMNPTEEDLIKNWAAIIFNNNRDKNRLDRYPLTASEMRQVIDAVDKCRNPYEVSKLINGGYIMIKRDNEDDKVNYGKDVYLKIFDAREIRAGQSTYQIVRQPKFNTVHPLASTRRGDVMLLINGMPVIHIELKRSGVDVLQAVNQIKRYTHDGIFSRGIFSLVQIFVAMTPEKTIYFANPGSEDKFGTHFQFHWADFNNTETCDWKRITANLLSIPMAHQMLGYYTIADDKDETLKVLRSYQYFAASKICDRVHETNWDDHAHKGGFIWHTTGSGKTMTSFKAAQLIANSGDADKVVFLLDRVELSTQSLDEYRGFAGENENISDTENTAELVKKLESNDKDECLIVTSLQKMSRINSQNNVAQASIDRIGAKRVVFIVDECHRGVFGDMLLTIKRTFPRAILFGFTGTPVFEENAHGEVTTETIFGDMLHKYTLANGIPDENVLGFDIYQEDTFEEHAMRKMVALRMAEAESEDEVEKDPAKQKVFDRYMHDVDIMKIEDEAKVLYYSDEHHNEVITKIIGEYDRLSKHGKFHAILATKNIPEAIAYYELLKQRYPGYNVATIFDDSIDNVDSAGYKQDAILEMLADYNAKFGTAFQQSTYAKYKKDVAKRLAHKKPYHLIDKDHSQQLDMLIVVTQMLTGYDSKWVNRLYVDKQLKYVDVIQAFSRTNRLFGPDKPFGIIKYFDRPHRMKKNIDDALALYVDQPMSVFVDHLQANLEKIIKAYNIIVSVFKAEGIDDFSHLPKAPVSRNKFASEFCTMTKQLQAAKMQGFDWEQKEYEFEHSNGFDKIIMPFDEDVYNVLLQRYRELFESKPGGGDDDDSDVYHLEAYITETGVGTINAAYINDKFVKFVKNLYMTGPGSEVVKTAQEELHKAFAQLSQRDQRTANRILHDIESGDLVLDAHKSIYDYIVDYQKREVDKQIFSLCEATGLNREKLATIIEKDVNEQNLDEYGQFEQLNETADIEKVVVFLKRVLGKEVKKMFVKSRLSAILRRFILVPADRPKIIFAYQNEGYVLDSNIPDELPEETPEETPDTAPTKDGQESASAQPAQDAQPQTPSQGTPVESNEYTEEEKRKNIARVAMWLFRKIRHIERAEDVVNAFYKIINIPTVAHLDGLAISLEDALDDLYGKKIVKEGKKHVCLGTLTMKFEVFLKKVYYLLNGHEIPEPEDSYATLRTAIRKFECLYTLTTAPEQHFRTLCENLDNIVKSRNTRMGNGAHFDLRQPIEKTEQDIKDLITMMLYVVGMNLDELKCKYPELR